MFTAFKSLVLLLGAAAALSACTTASSTAPVATAGGVYPFAVHYMVRLPVVACPTAPAATPAHA